jgi:oligoribonuclease NrnB/cAMP/cGMP phosphodiesterase (DHH superfamily)
MYKKTAEDNQEHVAKVTDNLLDITFNHEDWEFVQNECLRNIEKNEYLDIVRLSITCLGHIARIHNYIDKEKVLSILAEKINEKELSGFVDDALDDIEQFAANVTLDDIKTFPNLNRK